MYSELKETTSFLQSRGITEPEIGIVLGTGLGNLITEIDIEVELSYNTIPNFPIATVEFHFGKLIYGKIKGKQVLAMQGRYHFYEGHSMNQVVFPLRVMRMLGVSKVLMSNAAGSVNMEMKKGDLMLIDDHINLQPENPLRGPNLDDLGSRFPDMSVPYDKVMNEKLKNIAKQNDITLHEGVYASVQGPNLETRAEYRMLQVIGADAVGMSTVPEVIACNHMGIPCTAISVITDECDPNNLSPVDINDIIATAGKAELKLTKLYSELIGEL